MKKIMLLMAAVLFAVNLCAVSKKNNATVPELSHDEFVRKVWDFKKNKNFLREGNLPIILDFYATWCGPCKMLAPNLLLIQNKFKGKLLIYEIDVDKEPQLAELFKIQAMPTIVFIGAKDKYVVELGYREYPELEQMVRRYLLIK